MSNKIYNMKKQKGSILIIILILGFIFILSFGAITDLLISQHRLVSQKIAKEQAFQIAEAGLNYYKWHLAHDGDDFSGVSEQAYYDNAGNILGYYTVTAEPSEYSTSGRVVSICHKPGVAAEKTLKVASSSLSAHIAHGDYEGTCGVSYSSNSNVVAITATGWSVNYPNIKKIVSARYGKPSLAKYAFATASNVWFGEDEELIGYIHSNGGIRMDGTCNSRITSLKETYICGEEHGCADEEKPGIWGTGEKAELWDYPVTQGIDFDALTLDLDAIKIEATDHGNYFPASGGYGYKVIFSSDGTYNVRQVTKLENSYWGHDGNDWIYESIDYKNTSNVGTYTIPQNGLIFFADDIWVEGTVDGRATVVAARLPDGVYEDANIYIKNDILYTLKDGTNVLGLISQNDILITLYSENDLEIDAALLAQKGHVFRNYYDTATYAPYASRTKVKNYGTIITNGLWTWNWINIESGPIVSGYQQTITEYDPFLMYGPPPLFPTENEYQFISWEVASQ